MKRVVLTFGLLVLAGCATISSDDEKRAQLHLQIASSLLSSGQENPRALAELIEAQKLDPSDANIQLYLGIAYTMRERYEDAEKHFQKALKIKSNFTQAHFNYGQMLMQAHRKDEAIIQLKIAQQDLTYPQPEQVLTNLGLVYFQKQSYQTALKYLQQSVALKSNSDCPTQNLLGRTFFELSDYGQAAHVLDKAVKTCRDTQYDEPLFYAGLSYFRIGDRELARARLEDLVKKFNASAFSSKARVLLDMVK
jgi:type IV pilus biogenesis/stability protein PilW